jgi:sugar phosphate isomerase/epimerase
MFTSLNTGAISLDVPFGEALSLAQRHGFAALDLPPAESLLQLAAATSVEDIRERYEAVNLRPGGWALPVDFKGSQEVYERGLELLPQCAALAQALHSPWCFTWVLPYSDERDFDANMAWHVATLRPVAEILARYECRLGLEFLGPPSLRRGHKFAFIHTLDGALELARQIGTGNVGLLLDCWHWYTAHGTTHEIARLGADDVVYVHVNDAPAGRGIDEQVDVERLLPGASGVIDIAGFLQALERIGYTGPVVVEPFNDDLRALAPSERVAATAESLRRIYAQAGLTA